MSITYEIDLIMANLWYFFSSDLCILKELHLISVTFGNSIINSVLIFKGQEVALSGDFISGGSRLLLFFSWYLFHDIYFRLLGYPVLFSWKFGIRMNVTQSHCTSFIHFKVCIWCLLTILLILSQFNIENCITILILLPYNSIILSSFILYSSGSVSHR